MRSARTAVMSYDPVPPARLVALTTPLAAQAFYLTVPFGSQRASVTQTIGLTDISMTYDRPGVDGRKIWDGLVPYDSVWRAGANVNTVIAFTSPVTIGGKQLPAGRYGLFMIPTRAAVDGDPEPGGECLGPLQLQRGGGRTAAHRDAGGGRDDGAAGIHLRRPEGRRGDGDAAVGEAGAAVRRVGEQHAGGDGQPAAATARTAEVLPRCLAPGGGVGAATTTSWRRRAPGPTPPSGSAPRTRT